MNDENLQLARVEQMLEENLQVTEETNRMLREMRRWSRVGIFLRVFIWAALIILPLLLLKPILESLVPAAGGAGSGFLGFPTQADLEKALDSYQGQ